MPHQAGYSADDLEAGCVMYALKSIECFAQCRHVITDNSHVLHINKWVPINARQRPMLAYIMQFNISFVFTARCLAKRGICRRRVSVCLSVCVCVCHTSVLCKNG